MRIDNHFMKQEMSNFKTFVVNIIVISIINKQKMFIFKTMS